ncbi:MAG TPA: hypothetical protein VI168_03005 [Croceibacterium sp.]
MSEATVRTAPPKTPWHLWIVGILSLIWNAAGAWTIMSAQSGVPMDMDANEIAYYAAQAPWFVAVTDLVLISATLAAIALLLRSRRAVHLYALSIAGIAVTAGYDIAAGTALLLHDQGWLILELVTGVLAILQLVYAGAMRQRGLLR